MELFIRQKYIIRYNIHHHSTMQTINRTHADYYQSAERAFFTNKATVHVASNSTGFPLERSQTDPTNLYEKLYEARSHFSYM